MRTLLNRPGVFASLVLVIAVSVVGCSSEDGSVASVSVPDGWRTYTEGGPYFTISSPGDWSIIWNEPFIVGELYEEGDGDVADPLAIGLHEGDLVYSPEVQVRASTELYGGSDLDGLIEQGKQDVQAYPGLEWVSDEKLMVNGVESALLTISSDLEPEFEGSWWMKQLGQIDGDVTWIVTCGAQSPAQSEPTSEMEACRAVLETFIVHAP